MELPAAAENMPKTGHVHEQAVANEPPVIVTEFEMPTPN